MPTITPSEINAILSVVPSLIELIKSIHAVSNPGQPPLTSDQVLQILADLGAKTLAIDEAWKAQHVTHGGPVGAPGPEGPAGL